MPRYRLLAISLVIGGAGGGLGLADAQSTGGTTGGSVSATSVRQTMAAYNRALNDGKTAEVIPLYTRDGIFMAPFSESNVGITAIKGAYDKVFQELKFNVKFTIRELVVVSPVYAYVRTNSAGKTRHAASGKTSSEANQELFILRKEDDGKWRIARYSFSPTSPPSGGS